MILCIQLFRNMTQEDSIKSIIEEMTKQRPMSKDLVIFVESYIIMAWGVGFDEGRKQQSHRKPIVQKKNGKIVKPWESVNLAAKAVGVAPTSISQVLNKRYGHKTCAGFEWEYL